MSKCVECNVGEVSVASGLCDSCIESILEYLEADQERRILVLEQEYLYQQQFGLDY